MDKLEIRALIDRVFEDADRSFSDSEAADLVADCVYENRFHDANLISFLAYLQQRINDGPQVMEALQMHRAMVELCIVKNKDEPEDAVQGNNEKSLNAIKDRNKRPYCSFCGKSSSEVDRLVQGPQVYICNECVDTCVDLVKEPPQSG